MSENSAAGSAKAYTVVQLTIAFASLEEVQAREPGLLAEHLESSERLHEAGDLLMAGAFLEPAEHLETMVVLRSPDAARRFVDGDPFVRAGYALDVRTRAWANMFAPR
ncbi:hypothetical protein GCM10028798_32030 [Humibacter antri]